MKGTVFYSWQSDTDADACRYLIRDALKEALNGLSSPLDYDEATRGEPGSPEIFGTILKKIAKATLVVTDLTVVGRYLAKSTPNPNVLIEYGYALSAIGEDRIISVMNDHFGKPDELPFDLKSRAIRLCFTLPPNAESDKRKQMTQEIAGRLRRELQLALDSSLWIGISHNSRKAIELFVTESQDGAFQEPSFDFAGFCSRLSFSKLEAQEVVDELEGRGLIERTTALSDPFGSVSPRDQLFWTFDRLFKEWNVEQDALHVAKKLVGNGRPEGSQAVSITLAKELNWPARRINPTLTYLVAQGLVMASESHSHPYAVYSILETSDTRRFVRDARR